MKCAIITGASSGIGMHAAQQFLAAGWSVTNLSRRRCPISAVHHINCDLSQPGFVDNISAQLTPTLSSADCIVVIHNASRLVHDSAVETPSKNLRAVFEVNLVAPNTLNYFTIPYMQAGSAILYVGSTLAEKAVPGSYSYVVSKHGMIGMMRATCQDIAGRGIHTACICPGFTDTEMLRQHVPEARMDAVRSMSTFGRLIRPEEIAETLLWAATHPVVNGAVIHASLGQIEA